MELINFTPTDPSFAAQTLAITAGASAVSKSWARQAEGIFIWSDQPFWFVIVDEQTDVTTINPAAGSPIPALTPMAVLVPSQLSRYKVVARAIGTSGTLFLKPVLRN